MWKACALLAYFLVFFVNVTARNHQLKIKNDNRQNVLLSKFGYLPHSSFIMNVTKFEFPESQDERSLYRFSFVRTPRLEISPENDICFTNLSSFPSLAKPWPSIIYMAFDLKNSSLLAYRYNNSMMSVVIKDYNGIVMKPQTRTNFPLMVTSKTNVSLNLEFQFPTEEVQGVYTLYFHNCAGTKINLTVGMIEMNENNYLSAGDQPLPWLMFSLCGVYISLGLVWLAYLKMSNHRTFKIHYLMLAVTFIKALSLMFHGVNFYVLGKKGIHEEGWAIMYYITHLVKGALLFITIILIGAGWTFVKHMLTYLEKRLFVIVIPLQILANVAMIIIEESEEGNENYNTWKDIFILVDLLCCGAILFPIVWSIRHLQAAANSDGKVAINLQKMKLFRQFYVMIICYIYFTRIVGYLLTLTVTFLYSWLVEMSKELATILFFIVTGYMFRPVTDNPYFQLAQEDEDLEEERIHMEQVWSQSGSREGLVHVQHDTFGDESMDDTDVLYDTTAKRDQPQQFE